MKSDYFTAREARYEGVDKLLNEIGQALKSQGFTVLKSKNDRTEWICIEKGGKHIHLGFTDVPYRWYLSFEIDPKGGNGSGKTLKEQAEPFSIEEIISAMQPNFQGYKSPSYLEAI